MDIVAQVILQTQQNRSLCYNQAMKREIMAILACPLCKGELELSAQEENEKEIVSGSLHCWRCHEHYPITDTLPNLLPPDQRG